MPLFDRRLDIYHHVVIDGTTRAQINEALTLLRELNLKVERIMADTQATLAALAAANASIDGIRIDIDALVALIAAGGTPQEVSDAVNALAARLAGIDSER
jgi:outer membrane murein-binding lipoprotein Lpp